MSKTETTPEKKRGDRVLRGGSWYSAPQYARVAFSVNNTPGRRSGRLGVRLVEVIDEQD